jgi:hypothetical protein
VEEIDMIKSSKVGKLGKILSNNVPLGGKEKNGRVYLGNMNAKIYKFNSHDDYGIADRSK